MSKNKVVSFFSYLLLTLLSISFPGFSAEKEITVGAIYLDTQGYYAGVRQGVQDAALENQAKIQLIETNAQGDISKRVRLSIRWSRATWTPLFSLPFQKTAAAARFAGPVKPVFR